MRPSQTWSSRAGDDALHGYQRHLKLYVEEEGSIKAREALEAADAAATSRVAYAEAHAAFAAAARLGRIGIAERASVATAFRVDWRSLVVVDVSQPVVELVADLAGEYELRGFDAIHLASALLLQQRLGKPVRFRAWDRRLVAAAGRLGLT